MSWKAWVQGHQFDLEDLVELFSEGDPCVGHDAAIGYHVKSERFGRDDGQPDAKEAEVVVKRINGIARAHDSGFRPVHLTGRFTAPDGRSTTVIAVGAAESREKARSVTMLVDGVRLPAPAPKGPRYFKIAEADADVADVLRVMAQPEHELDWYDVYKIWEIVRNAAGGQPQIIKRGWMTKADIERLTASANHPGISGGAARHARMEGQPGPTRVMTLAAANALIGGLVTAWVQSHPNY